MADCSPRLGKRKIETLHDDIDEDSSKDEYRNASYELMISKAKKETIQAKIAELELEIALKHVILKSDVEKVLFESSRALRDRLLGLAIHLAPKLANIDDTKEITTVLKKAIEENIKTFTEELKKI